MFDKYIVVYLDDNLSVKQFDIYDQALEFVESDSFKQ